MGYLIKLDPAHSRFKGRVSILEYDMIRFNNQKIHIYRVTTKDFRIDHYEGVYIRLSKQFFDKQSFLI